MHKTAFSIAVLLVLCAVLAGLGVCAYLVAVENLEGAKDFAAILAGIGSLLGFGLFVVGLSVREE